MRVSLEWLREYVEIDLEAEELAERLTRAGFEVGAWEYLGAGLEKVFTGEIVRLERHPDADHLQVARVDLGPVGLMQLVTGAPNAAVGQKVVVALPGANLPNLGPVRQARFRGVVSEGVVCSAWELGLEGHRQEEGILILPPETPPGRAVAPYIGLDDTVLEIDITPNRADCLGLVNLAREVAAITGGRLRLPPYEVDSVPEPAREAATVTIEAPDLCARYVAAIIRGVTIGPSPSWMQRRLRAAGMRPINNVVDITNYVMLELGQPLHAFDYHRLQGPQIVVRRARPGEKLRTLDGVERLLVPETLVIADARRAVAIAGIMGGEETEISEATRWILLESANFSPASIRRTSRTLGLRSEASLRFERGIDLELAPRAAYRAARLMRELAGGEVLAGLIDCGEKSRPAVTIDLNLKRLNSLLGLELTRAEVKEYLGRLGLVPEERGETFSVSIPSYRADLRLEEDLVEEVARLYGYERIPAIFPPFITAEAKQEPRQQFFSGCRHFLAAVGFQEVITYSFIGPRAWERLRLPPGHPWRQVVSLRNPLGEEQSIMRPTLVPGLLQAAAENASWRNEAMRLFEVGKVFLPQADQPLPREEWRLAALVAGEERKGWDWPGYSLDFFYLKGVLAAFLDHWGLGNGVSLRAEAALPALHPGRQARVRLGEREVGWIGELHPEVREDYGLPERASLLELDLETLWSLAAGVTRTYQPWARYPAVARDIAVVVPRELSHETVVRSIMRAGGELLREVRLFDLYQGEPVPAGYKSLAYRLVFQSADHTLRETEINALYEAIAHGLERELGARLRR